jgi:hypothetical protein
MPCGRTPKGSCGGGGRPAAGPSARCYSAAGTVSRAYGPLGAAEPAAGAGAYTHAMCVGKTGKLVMADYATEENKHIERMGFSGVGSVACVRRRVDSKSREGERCHPGHHH